MIQITIKRVCISLLSAVLVSLIAVGGSAIATYLFYYLNGEQFGHVITTTRVIWFSIIFALSFVFILFSLDKKNEQ